MDKDLLLNNMQMQYANNGYQLNDFLLTNITGSTLKLSNLLDDHYKIIFRFSYLHCSSCVEFELKNIIEIAERMPKDRIIIIAEYDNKRGFSAFTKAHNITLPIYFLSENTHADNILQDENIPYVCLMDKKMKIEYSHQGSSYLFRTLLPPHHSTIFLRDSSDSHSICLFLLYGK